MNTQGHVFSVWLADVNFASFVWWFVGKEEKDVLLIYQNDKKQNDIFLD